MKNGAFIEKRSYFRDVIFVNHNYNTAISMVYLIHTLKKITDKQKDTLVSDAKIYYGVD